MMCETVVFGDTEHRFAYTSVRYFPNLVCGRRQDNQYSQSSWDAEDEL